MCPQDPMRRSSLHPRLPALIVLAALAVRLPDALAQPPSLPSPQVSSQAQFADSASQPRAAAPTLQPTPEEAGDALEGHQRYQAAIEAYKQAPDNSPELWNKMGIAYQMMFNLKDASRCYQRSLKLNPKNASVLNNLATVYDSLKQFSDAERIYRKALKIDPTSALILKNLGTNLLAQHRYKKGWEDYKAALAIDPRIFENTGSPRVENPASAQDRGAMNYYMARGCIRAGETDRAIEYLRMALNEGFTNPRKLEADSDFASLHGLPAFEQLLASERLQ
jgi:tetratricopeptide (TPR) repeat protein